MKTVHSRNQFQDDLFGRDRIRLKSAVNTRPFRKEAHSTRKKIDFAFIDRPKFNKANIDQLVSAARL
jgi:hypothetical protein